MNSADLMYEFNPRVSARAVDPARDLFLIDRELVRSASFRSPFTIGHRMAGHPLFSLERLVGLSRTLPPEDVEYYSGDAPVSLPGEQCLTPATGLSLQEAIRRIEHCGSWIALKHVERIPEYRELLDLCLDEIQGLSEPALPGMCAREGFIFVSSPGAVTPYHIDSEYNFLLQIRGTKAITIFDGFDRSILSEGELESFYSEGRYNLEFRAEYEKKSSVFELRPGAGVYLPPTAPHWVKNGGEPSVSFSITFETRALDRRSAVYTFNSRLRKLGLKPAPYDSSPLVDSIKYNGFRTVRRMKTVLDRVTGRLSR